MKNSKPIIFLVIVVLILAVILIIKMQMPNPNDNFQRLTPEEVREKILAGLNYNNYTITYEVDGTTRIKKVKDNIIVAMEPSTGIYSWNDSRRRISVAGNTVTDTYVRVPVPDEASFSKHFLLMEENLKDYGDYLYHIKNEKYKGKECLVIKAGEDKGETYWVDAEMGFILKYEAIDGTKGEFSFEIDNVTDKDIEAPMASLR